MKLGETETEQTPQNEAFPSPFWKIMQLATNDGIVSFVSWTGHQCVLNMADETRFVCSYKT